MAPNRDSPAIDTTLASRAAEQVLLLTLYLELSSLCLVC